MREKCENRKHLNIPSCGFLVQVFPAYPSYNVCKFLREMEREGERNYVPHTKALLSACDVRFLVTLYYVVYYGTIILYEYEWA